MPASGFGITSLPSFQTSGPSSYPSSLSHGPGVLVYMGSFVLLHRLWLWVWTISHANALGLSPLNLSVSPAIASGNAFFAAFFPCFRATSFHQRSNPSSAPPPSPCIPSPRTEEGREEEGVAFGFVFGFVFVLLFGGRPPRIPALDRARLTALSWAILWS